MSGVRKKDQAEHRFSVLDAILDMYDHTTNVISNEKIFDPKFQKLIDEIDYYAKDIYHKCRVANEELDNRVEDEARMRIELEEEAMEMCKWLKTDIMLAQRKFHLRARKVTYWKGLVDEARNSISNWNASEKRHYKQTFIHGL